MKPRLFPSCVVTYLFRTASPPAPQGKPARLGQPHGGVGAHVDPHEKDAPSVGMGMYATALWLMVRHAALPEGAAPAHDLNVLEQDFEAVRQRGRRMSRK
jgi:hypothetical protein